VAGSSPALRTDSLHFRKKKYFGRIRVARSLPLCSHFQSAVSVTSANQGRSSVLPKKAFCSICGIIKGLSNINKCCMLGFFLKSLCWYHAKYKIPLYDFKEIANVNT